MTTPLSALCPSYTTREDDILKVQLTGRSIFINPAYAVDRHHTGTTGIEVVLRKLIEHDVRERGCTLVALLPSITRAPWWWSCVMKAHEVRAFPCPAWRPRAPPRAPPTASPRACRCTR